MCDARVRTVDENESQPADDNDILYVILTGGMELAACNELQNYETRLTRRWERKAG